MVETKMMPIKTEEDGDDADADGMVKVDISDTNGPDKESLYLLKDQKKSSSGEEVNTRPNENKMKIFIISAVLGNILAWYDFGVFASFSSELSRAFFTGGRLVEMLKVYGVFAAAFFARPLGGFVLGLIGDKFARTISLQISVVAMGFSALFIACLPTNSVGAYKIGPAATVLLVSARIVQGLSTGGEMVGSMLYMVENVPETSKCLVSAIPMASAIAAPARGTWSLPSSPRSRQRSRGSCGAGESLSHWECRRDSLGSCSAPVSPSLTPSARQARVLQRCTATSTPSSTPPESAFASSSSFSSCACSFAGSTAALCGTTRHG